MKHTKGEWGTSKYSHDIGVYSSESPNGKDICLVRGNDEEAQANSQLIIAAPKLLEQLKKALDLLNDLRPGRTTAWWRENIRPIEQAIYNAENE